MEYRVRVVASESYEDIELQLNEFLAHAKPPRVLMADMVADGTEYPYAAIVLYQVRFDEIENH